MSKKRAPRASTKVDPAFAAYMIKKIDRAAWADFTKRAKDEGRTLVWLFKDFITRYANGEPTRS